MKRCIVSCCVKQSIAACLEYHVLIGNIFIEGVSRELACLSLPHAVSYCAYEHGMHAFFKSDLIAEVMYNGKDITFLGPHVCYTRTLYWKPL